MEKIEKIFMFVIENPVNKEEGIIAANMDGSWIPFVGSDLARVNKLIPLANEIAQQANETYKILYFSNREDVTSLFKSEIYKKQTEQ
jgi:hypothetical protein